MLEKISNTGHAALHGLGELDKTSHTEKTPETKIEAAVIRASAESKVTNTKHYQLDGPKAPAFGDQASAVAKLMDGLASTTNLLMQITENALAGKDVAKSSSEAIS